MSSGGRSAALGFIPIIVIAIIIGSYFALSVIPASTTTTVPVVGVSFYYPTTAESTNSTLGLSLLLSANSTLLNFGDSLSLNISLNNTLPTLNNISSTTVMPISGLTLGPCGRLNYPFGVEVLQGYYSSSNISEANTPLSLWAPGAYSCPMMSYVNYYVFQPMSDYGSIYVLSNGTSQQCCFSQLGQPDPIAANLAVSRYWDAAGNEHSLPPSVYTVVGGDEWGQTVLLHFVISENNGQSQQTTTSVSCVQSGPVQSVYVTVVSDATPNHTLVQGANVSGFITVDMNGQNTSYPILPQYTPSNGTVLLQLSSAAASCTIGVYTIIVLTNGGSYSVQISPPTLHLSQIVAVTVGIPSGRLLDMHITNGGECGQNGTTVTNGTGFFC